MLLYEEPVQHEGEHRYFLLQFPQLPKEYFANTDTLYTFRLPRDITSTILYEWFDQQGIYYTTPSMTPGQYDWSNASDEVLERFEPSWADLDDDECIAVQTYLTAEQITTMFEMLSDRSQVPYAEVTKDEFYKKHGANFNEIANYATVVNTYYDGGWSCTWLSPQYYR